MPQSPVNKKLIRITTVPMALRYLLSGQMRFMSENGFDVLMISADGKELNEVIKREQCRHIIVPMTRKITPFRDLSCLFRLIKIFRKERPDIVHTHTPKAGLLGMIAARLCGVRIRIHTVAGLPLMVENGFKYRLLKFTERRTSAAATQVWPNSNSLLEYIIHHRLANPKKLHVIGKGSTNGIDLDDFNREGLDEKTILTAKAVLKYSPTLKYLLYAGRLVADKGLVELMHVFSALRKENSFLRLILVGDFENSLDPLPADILHEIEFDPAVIRIGWTNDLKYYMHLAGFFIFPSHREGFPNVLLQAGAMELPILCSRIPGNTDLVTDHETGLTFETGNERHMVEQARYAFSHSQELRIMSANLLRNIRENYRRENIWQNILNAYKSLVH